MKLAQTIKPAQFVVQLGNPTDTNGADIAVGKLIALDPQRVPLDMMYFIATPKGIALASLEPDGYYYCTHCMPLSYSDWIATHWNIDITDEIRSMVDEAGFLIRGIRDEDQLNQALITVKSL